MGPFDITSDDIKRLDDDQLRLVLNFLLEAEANKHGIPLSAIRLGGDQNAADGGADARVEDSGAADGTDWLPKFPIIFQSKAEDMERSKLIRELKPNGVIRSFFEELAQKEGAYIVFSTNNCSESMYQDRISAMR